MASKRGRVDGLAENVIGRQMKDGVYNHNNIVESDYACKMRLLSSLIDREETRRKRCTEELKSTMAHSQEILDQIQLLNEETASVRRIWHKLKDKNEGKAAKMRKLYKSMQTCKLSSSQNATKLMDVEKQVEALTAKIEKLKEMRCYFQIKEELHITYGTPKDDVDQFMSEIFRMYSRIYDKILEDPDEDRVTQFIVRQFRQLGRGKVFFKRLRRR